MPDCPSTRSMRLDDFSTVYTMATLITMAIMMLITWYSARKDNSEVNVPAPAINGKAIGTIEAVAEDSSLYS